MEIDRINRSKGLRVERTGKEQDRKGRNTDIDFDEILEASMEDDSKKEEKEQHQNKRKTDTVSISRGTTTTPLITDLVSISAAARVGAEVLNAQQSIDDKDVPTKTELIIPGFLSKKADKKEDTDKPSDEKPPESPNGSSETDEPNPKTPPKDDSKIDTVA